MLMLTGREGGGCKRWRWEEKERMAIVGDGWSYIGRTPKAEGTLQTKLGLEGDALDASRQELLESTRSIGVRSQIT